MVKYRVVLPWSQISDSSPPLWLSGMLTTCSGVPASGLMICNWLTGPTMETASQGFLALYSPGSDTTVLVFSAGKAPSKRAIAPRVFRAFFNVLVRSGSRLPNGGGPAGGVPLGADLWVPGAGTSVEVGECQGESATPPASTAAKDSTARRVAGCEDGFPSWGKVVLPLLNGGRLPA